MCLKMCPKIDWSAKTPGHRLSTRSLLAPGYVYLKPLTVGLFLLKNQIMSLIGSPVNGNVPGTKGGVPPSH